MPYERASANRIFGYALIASLALHALLLGVDLPEDAFTRPVEFLAPLVARLVEPAPPPPAPAEEKRPETKRQKPEPEQKPEAGRKTVRQPKPAPEAALPAAVPRSAEARRTAEPVLPAPAPAPPPASAPVPAPVARSAPVNDRASLIAQYQSAVVAEAGRHKSYPPQAEGAVGVVTVRISVGADGSIGGVKVVASSGYGFLDREAVAIYRRAITKVPVPSGLHGAAFSLQLRVIFKPENQASG